MRIGFKTSRHSGQQFLTFRPAKVVYEYRRPALYPKSGQSIKYIGEYADYGDFLTFSETALTTYIDPVVEAEPLRRWETSLPSKIRPYVLGQD